jgi:Heterokaryon incompatibility protein (HET)
MKAIYVGATRVAPWIGEEYGTSNAAFKLFHTLPEYGTMEKWYETIEPVRNDSSMEPQATAIIEAVLLQFTHRYWSRVWVSKNSSSQKTSS